MSRVQYIRNSQGEPVYAVLPIEEYHALLARQIACDDKTDEDLIELDYEQADVAEKTGLTQSAISQAERKGSKPQKRTMEKLAKIYDCLPEQLTL